MKMRRLLISALCLALIAASGCGPKHTAVSIAVIIPSPDGTPYTQASSVLAEKGATLTFEAAPGSPSDTTLEVQFLKNGVAAKVCSEPMPLTGPSPLTCHLISTGDFIISINETSHGKQHRQPTEVNAYIRPCKGCRT
jgi:hypothetical protein